MDRQDVKIGDQTVIKELAVGKEITMKKMLEEYQNSIINFCKDINMMQNRDNFFNLSLQEQFAFNDCVEYTSDKLKKDFKEIENFYLGCKNICIKRDPENEIKIDNYINKKINLKFKLSPCIQDCMLKYDNLNLDYYNYMIKESGFYMEFVNFKKL